MSQDSTAPDGAWAVARLLAGAPIDDIDAGTLPNPWASVIQAIAQASGGERLATFEALLARLPGEQAAAMRTQVGRAGRMILQGRTEAAPKTLPEVTGSAILDLPQAACPTPELQAQTAEAGQWLDAYVSFASDISPLTPPELHQSAGPWLGSVSITRSVRLRLRPDDLCPNLLVRWIYDATICTRRKSLHIALRPACTMLLHPRRSASSHPKPSWRALLNASSWVAGPGSHSQAACPELKGATSPRTRRHPIPGWSETRP